jgi:predicted flavoprotein YhiN
MEAAAWDEALRSGRGRVLSLLRQKLPERLAALLMEEAGLDPALGFSELKREGRRNLVAALADYPLPVEGTQGWTRAEVTAGGVSLEDVRSDTLESRIAPGLFFAGEMLDAFGPVGGYNLYWAFLTGRLAGLGAAGRD